jgi:hypothetical protein
MTTTAAIAAVTEDRFLRSDEVAAILRATPRTITARCHRGVYAGAVMHEGYWLIPESAIRAVIAPRQAPTTPTAPADLFPANADALPEGGTS